MLYATDTVSLDDVHVSDAGYLEAFARTVRTGCQQYLGAELKRPDLGIVTVYRDEAEVFSHDSLHSFAQIPVTIDHPPGGVNARNWRQVARGTTGNEVLRDGQYLRLGLKVKDAEAVQAIRDGKCELSAGYRCELLWGDGIAPDGTKYQARQVGIVADHVAIVAKGRAGAACRIGDAAWPTDGARAPDPQGEPRNPPPSEGNSMKTHMIGDNAVEMSDAAIVAVKGLQTQLATLTTDLQTVNDSLAAAQSEKTNAIQAKDGEIAALKAQHQSAIEAKDGEIAATKAMIPDAAKLDVLAAGRAELIGKAKAILGDAFVAAGKPDAEIRKAVVSHALGDAAKDMTDAAIEGAFAVVSAGKVAVDPVRRVLSDARNVPVTDAASAHREMLDRMSSAWKHTDAKGNA